MPKMVAYLTYIFKNFKQYGYFSYVYWWFVLLFYGLRPYIFSLTFQNYNLFFRAAIDV